jgi:hypothetical protein
MADEIRATPRNSLAALLSDAINSGVGYMKDTRRTQQLQGLGRLIESTGIPATVENLSYDPSGRGLFTGAGGLGGTTRMRPEALEAAMNVAPMVGPANRGLMQATKGLPVGASIKSVGKDLFEASNKYHQKVPEVTNINVANLKRMNSGEVADVSDEVAARMDFSQPIKVSVFADGEMRIVDGHHRVAAAKKLGIDSLPVELQAINAKGDVLNNLVKQDSYIRYPQQQALDTAQRNAALPVEQGGLGLPTSNTAEMRAQAMGGIDAVHFSRQGGDYSTLDSGKFAIAPFDAVGTHVGSPQAAMERFQNTVGYKVGNPNYAFDELKGTSYPVKVLGDKPLLNQNGMPWGEDDLNTFLRQSGGHNWSDVNGGKLTYQDLNADLRKKLFEQQGYTSIPYFNEVEGKGSISYIAPPENLRSSFAAFDPMRRSAAIAAAMGLAAPDLLANQAPVNPMYTDPFPDTTR